MVSHSSAIPLSAFLGVIEDAVHEIFGDRKFWVIAETSDVKIYRDRYYAFLNLIEKDGAEIIAKEGAAIWRNSFSKISNFEKTTGVTFESNLKLALQLSVNYNSKYGFRLVIHDIDSSFTLGQLSQQREKILLSLSTQFPALVWRQDERYVSANQFLKARSIYNKIILIAAPNSDGYRDFVHELENNTLNLKFQMVLFSVPVQGDAASSAMVNAIQKANMLEGYHAIVLVRGGGSQTDFSPFDSYELSLAVASSKLPVFTGIGHERNVSIVDELAFLQLKTPTKCAAHLIEINAAVLSKLQSVKETLLSATFNMMADKHYKLQTIKTQMAKGAVWLVAAHKQNVLHQLQKVAMLDPVNTILRGYSLLRKDGKIKDSISSLELNESIEIQMRDGNVKATITDKKQNNGI